MVMRVLFYLASCNLLSEHINVVSSCLEDLSMIAYIYNTPIADYRPTSTKVPVTLLHLPTSRHTSATFPGASRTTSRDTRTSRMEMCRPLVEAQVPSVDFLAGGGHNLS